MMQNSKPSPLQFVGTDKHLVANNYLNMKETKQKVESKILLIKDVIHMEITFFS